MRGGEMPSKVSFAAIPSMLPKAAQSCTWRSRGASGDGFKVHDQDVMSEVLQTRSAFLSFADDVRSGALCHA